MGNDAYAELIALIRGQDGAADGMLGSAPVRMRRGRVVSTEPLCVEVAGLRQPANALWINAGLVKGAAWKVKLTSPEKSSDATLDRADVQLLEPALAPGDHVLLLTEDDQIYYMIAKVVKAG